MGSILGRTLFARVLLAQLDRQPAACAGHEIICQSDKYSGNHQNQPATQCQYGRKQHKQEDRITRVYAEHYGEGLKMEDLEEINAPEFLAKYAQRHRLDLSEGLRETLQYCHTQPGKAERG